MQLFSDQPCKACLPHEVHSCERVMCCLTDHHRGMPWCPRHTYDAIV